MRNTATRACSRRSATAGGDAAADGGPDRRAGDVDDRRIHESMMSAAITIAETNQRSGLRAAGWWRRRRPSLADQLGPPFLHCARIPWRQPAGPSRVAATSFSIFACLRHGVPSIRWEPSSLTIWTEGSSKLSLSTRARRSAGWQTSSGHLSRPSPARLPTAVRPVVSCASSASSTPSGSANPTGQSGSAALQGPHRPLPPSWRSAPTPPGSS